MPVSVHEAIYLGNFADADSDEGSVALENTAPYLQNFGSFGDPLRDHQQNLTFDDADSDGSIETDNISASETVSYDLGGGPVVANVDSLVVVSITATYTDGTVINYSNVVMFQDTTGNMFLANSDFAGTDLNISGAGLQSINVTSIDGSAYTGLFHQNMQDFVCFAKGTRLAAARGARAVEELRIGDLLWTYDHGVQPVRWIGRRLVSLRPEDSPVRIKPNALGPGRPDRELLVSPQHRIMISDAEATSQVFVAAKHLTALRGISRARGIRRVEYFHVLMPQHEVLNAQGAPTESFWPGPMALRCLTLQQVAQIGALIPIGTGAMRLARPEAKGKARDRLIARLVEKQKAGQQLPRLIAA